MRFWLTRTAIVALCAAIAVVPLRAITYGLRLIVSITITGDSVCRATNVAYRLDTTSARSFLAAYVALP
jgi:hypothetical protein